MTTLYNPREYYKLDEVDYLKDIYRKAKSKCRNWIRGKSRTSTTILSVLRQHLAEDKKRSKPDVQARQQTISFHSLPPEIRNYIYELALVKTEPSNEIEVLLMHAYQSWPSLPYPLVCELAEEAQEIERNVA